MIGLKINYYASIILSIITMCMPMASSSSTCIMSSEGPESADINSEAGSAEIS